MLAGFGIGKNLFKVLAHLVAVVVEHDEHRRPVGEIHAAGNHRPSRGVDRQHVCLLVLDVLQAVLQAAQENIGFTQFAFAFGREQFAFDQ